MRYLIYVAIFCCMCVGQQQSSKSFKILSKKSKHSELTEDEFIKFLGLKKMNPKQISEIANDTSFKDIYRQFALYYLIENYCVKKITLEEFRKLLNSPTWLKREYTKMAFLYVGPPPSFFDDTSSGVNMVLQPQFSKLSKSRICFKIGVDSLYKGEPTVEDILFRYLKGEYNSSDFDRLTIIKIKVERKRGNNYL